MKKVCIHTLGCKVNQYESDSLVLALEKQGYTVTTKFESADIFILNTCAVTNEAEKKSRQMVSKMRSLNKDAKIYVCGCATQNSKEQFENLENVVFISGTANKLNLINSFDEQQEEISFDLPLIYEDSYVAKQTKTRAYIKIQDGCDNFCTYCIIPYLRGRSRSREIISILNEIQLLDNSIREIVLTGVNISDYKVDGNNALIMLLLMLKDYNFRIRLGSIEQGIITEDFIYALKSIDNLCPHFHLSLQSGSNNILKKMNRHYTINEFHKSVKLLKKLYNNPAITTDIIVGFPGETELEFRKTCAFVKKIGFSRIHIFVYSSKKGTKAAEMKQIDPETKKRRLKILEKIGEELENKYIKKCIKQPHSVLIEEQIGDYYVGYTENYVKCYVDSEGEELELNTFINVKFIEKFKDGVLAEQDGVDIESIHVF